ncbi:hypothetical protein TNCV_3636011 [Trichonephila clavipes]|nr:hypothetical protein TNCV_3636011 [Trichonephila clavipes]
MIQIEFFLNSLSSWRVEDLLSLVECFHLSKTLLEIWSKPYERSLLVNLIVASLRLLSSGGKPHSCSAFSLLVDDTAPIIILAALCCTESSFRLTEIEAGVQIGVAYSKTGLITVQKVLFRV